MSAGAASIATIRRPALVRWCAALALALLLLAGCASGSGGGDPYSGRYGGSLNHIHDLLALRGVPNTVLLAAHAGLYRTSDGGHTWHVVAGLAGQTMDGLMIFKFAQSPVDPRRVYVLAIPRTDRPKDAKAPAGLYASADAGQTWQLAAPVSAFPGGAVYSIGAGSGAAGQIYALLPSLGVHGLYATNDGGAHWQALPPLPDSHPTGVTGDPLHPGHIIFWSASTGVYTSADAGQTWRTAAGVTGGIFALAATPTLIYASGDAGAYVSRDGTTYALANPTYTFAAIAGCAGAPTNAWAVTGTAVYVSGDSGHTWSQTAATASHPGNLTADPTDPRVAYVGFSYPIGVQLTSDGGAHWRAALP
ncbi:MAG TPA: hypothetical protein VID73_08870 [Ktedonobacterales bacterium]